MTDIAPLDKIKYMPDELTSGCNGQCVGFTVSDIVGNIIGQQCDLSFSYALGLWMGDLLPTTIGEDPYAAMAAAVAFGALPLIDDTPQQLTMSQLERVNIANYTPQQFQQAKIGTQNGIMYLGSYQEIVDYVRTYKQGVSLAMKFYRSFLIPNQDGTLPAISGDFSYHNVGVWNDGIGLLIKPYCGATYGLGGYAYLTEANYDLTEIGAWGFTPGWRWFNLVKIALQYPKRIPQILPLLSTK
jgi:hypothetical protein